MPDSLPPEGAVHLDLAPKIHDIWIASAPLNGIDLATFNPMAPLAERIAWALERGLEIGSVLSRFSSKLQHSTEAQIRECIQFAAAHGIYVPWEFVCVDEGVSGRKVRRDGLNRIKLILKHKMAKVLLVYKVSRLFRVAYLGFQFFQEEVVEESLRAISISQGIDTTDKNTWKALTYLHGIMDDMLLTTIADHVRSGITNLFQAGYVTGALTVGYVGVNVAGMPTKLGRPRRVPKVNAEVAVLIRQHFEWIRDGMSIREGWRRWLKAGGPCDPRSKVGRMSPQAYRRMLSNPRYMGCWAFGRKRNSWSSKRDYTRQTEQPETEVRIIQSEELRIVSDELFHAVQARLGTLKLGPRGPKRRKDPRLCDLVTECFYCSTCSTPDQPMRFYHAGANGHGMRCKRGDLCPCLTVVRRDVAVTAICKHLQNLLGQDADMIERTVARSQAHDAVGDDQVRQELAVVDKRLAINSNKVNDLKELAGEGSAEDRAELKASVRKALSERAPLLAEQARLKKALSSTAATLTPDRVREVLGNLVKLLEDGAAGQLGQDVIYRASAVFRLLVGGRIMVHVDRRPCRKGVNVYCTFTPQTLATAKEQLEDHRPVNEGPAAAEARVWLREPPQRDQLAERVHVLMDIDGKSYREAAKVLQSEGLKINSGVVWQIYRRYYEMIGQPVPESRYNNGRPRKPRTGSTQ